MDDQWSNKNGVASLILLLSVLFLGYVPSQSDFELIFIFAAASFGAYVYLVFVGQLSFRNVLVLGLLLRAAMLFSFPQLSDDIYRFLWDGHLTMSGLNPYGYLPSSIIQETDSPYMRFLYDEMNSPSYYTIYPPFAQLIFFLSNFGGENLYLSSIIFKVCFVITEVFTVWGLSKLLKSIGRDPRWAAIYFINPLVLIEGMGNLHFEIVMVCFFVWSIYFLFVRNKMEIGAGLFVLAVASKLLPLMFLPYFLFRLVGKERLRFFMWIIGLSVLAFLPIILGLDFANFGSSVDLYFQKFEFNGGIYYLLRYVGQLISGYNLIHYVGPGLGLIAVFLIMRKAKSNDFYNMSSFLNFAFYSFSTYLFLATTIHPWYLIMPIALSVFVSFRFMIFWSFLILFTYINYSYEPYCENLWIVSIEYFVVFIYLYFEIHRLKNCEVKTVNS